MKPELVATLPIEVYGKCILSGEHSVLRGCPALVVPLKSRSLIIDYEPTHEALKIESRDAVSDPTKIVMWGVLEKAMSQLGKTLGDLEGTLKVKNTIPFGAGLGASAALCVATSKFLCLKGWINENAIFEFSRNLENIFHGESSGVDVAVAQRAQPIKYIRGQGFTDLDLVWKPQLFLSFSGQKGVTSDCVKTVADFAKIEPQQADSLDKKMFKSVETLETALTQKNLTTPEREMLLIEGLWIARECFERWGLTKGSLEDHMRQLESLGASAVKPTGSGKGGHVLSYWKTSPPVVPGLQIVPLPL